LKKRSLDILSLKLTDGFFFFFLSSAMHTCCQNYNTISCCPSLKEGNVIFRSENWSD